MRYYVMNSFDMIPQYNLLIERLITIFTGMADGQMDTIAVVTESIIGVESCRARFTGVLSFVAVTLHVPLQKTSTAYGKAEYENIDQVLKKLFSLTSVFLFSSKDSYFELPLNYKMIFLNNY